MADFESLIYEFLDKEGVSNLSKALLTKVNTRIQERIVDTLDENSDTNHVPSAAAVYTAISKLGKVQFKTHIGSIEDVENPNSNFIYLQRDDENDTTWEMYIYQEPTEDEETGSWINFGNTEVDLTNYWSKSDDDITALKLALGIPESYEELVARVESIETALDTKVDRSQMVKLTNEEIESAVTEAFNETAPVL